MTLDLRCLEWLRVYEKYHYSIAEILLTYKEKIVL